MLPTRLLDWSFKLLLALVPFLFYAGNYELFEFNKMIAVYALTIVIVALWIWRMIALKKIIFTRTFLDIPLLAFLASQILSTIFSIDRHVSLWGYYSRFNGGLISTISYILLYWAYVSNVPDLASVKKHLKYLLVSGLIISLYGIFEHFGVSPSCILIYRQFNDSCWVQDVQNRVFATLGQPNWLAACFWVFWAVLSGLLFLTTIYTKSRSGFLAFAISNVVFWGISGIVLIKHLGVKGLSKIAKPFFILNSLFAVIIALSGTPWTKSVLDLIDRKESSPAVTLSTSPALEGGGTETGAIRKIVWEGAINIGLAYPIFGSGVETFAQSYYQFRPREHNDVSEWDFLYNKAHNEYLNFWATTGIVGLGSYLFLILVVLISITRRIFQSELTEDKAFWQTAFLAGYISILITNFFGFSVVTVQLLFFLFPAMATIASNKQETANLETKDEHPLSDIQKAQLGILTLVAAFLLWQVVQMWRADTHYANANKLYQAGDANRALLSVKEAIGLNGSEPVYRDLLAQISTSLVSAYKKENDIKLITDLENVAITQSNLAVTASPYNLQFWNSRTKIFYTLAQADNINQNEFVNESLTAVTKATKLAPSHPKTFYNLGLTLLQVGKVDDAKASFTKSIQLKPNYKEPRYALALISAGDKDYKEAISQIDYILNNIDPNDADLSDLRASWSSFLTP